MFSNSSYFVLIELSNMCLTPALESGQAIEAIQACSNLVLYIAGLATHPLSPSLQPLSQGIKAVLYKLFQWYY